MVLELVTRIPNKYVTSLTFRVIDRDHDILGHNEVNYPTMSAKLNDIETMMASALPVTVTSVSVQLNNKYAFVDSLNQTPHTIKIKDAGHEGYICQMELIEI